MKKASIMSCFWEKNLQGLQSWAWLLNKVLQSLYGSAELLFNRLLTM